jgi:hypothetical protein
MDISIDAYKSNFRDGAKAYLFYVNVQFPGAVNVTLTASQADISTAEAIMYLTPLQTGPVPFGIPLPRNFPYYVKSTSLPETTIQETSTFWCGQEYKIAGTQRFAEWTVTFYIDNKSIILNKFREWMNIIHNPQTNYYAEPMIYMTEQSLYLLSATDNGQVICCYKLYGMWPKQIGQVALDYGSNELAQFDVTFAYQYHTVTYADPGLSIII